MMYFWELLYLFAFIALIYYWNSRNAVWGGLTMGVLIGVVWKFISGGDWWIVAKIVAVVILVGVASEILGKVADRMRRF